MSHLVRQLAKELVNDVASLKRRQATVSSVGSASVTLNLGGTTATGVRYLSSYTPVAGDTVFALLDGADVLVLGRVATTGDTWVAPTFQNGWSNWNSSTHSAAGYWRDAAGVVHLRGLVTGGTVAPGATGTVFTLPTGFRPVRELIFPAIAVDALAQVRVGATGTVVAWAGSNTWLSLEGITFRAEQ